MQFWNVETDIQPEIASYVGRNTVTLDDLDSGTRYAFRVRSRAGHGHSSWSDIVNAETEIHSGSKGGFLELSNKSENFIRINNILIHDGNYCTGIWASLNLQKNY